MVPPWRSCIDDDEFRSSIRLLRWHELIYGDGMTPTAWNPDTTAIVCVECQNGVLGPESVLPALAADSAGLIANLRRLPDGARDRGGRVVHATYEGTLGGKHPGPARLWRALGPATAAWAPGT